MAKDNKKDKEKLNSETDKKLTDKKSTDKKSTDKKSTDKKSTDKKSTDKKSTDKKSTDKKSIDKESTDKKLADKESTDKKPADKKSTDKKSTDKKSIDKKSTDKKSMDKKSTDKKSTDKASTDKKLTDRKLIDKKSTDKKSTDKKSTDKKSTDKKSTDKVSTDKKSTDRKPTDRKPTDKKSTDKTSIDKTSTDKASADKASTDKASIDKASTDKASIDKASIDKASTDKKSTDKKPTDKKPTDKKPTDKKSTDKKSTEIDENIGKRFIEDHKNDEYIPPRKSSSNNSNKSKIVTGIACLILGLGVGGFGTYMGLRHHDNSTTIAKINKNGTRLTSADLVDELAGNAAFKKATSHQLTIKVLSALYPDEYKAYKKDADKYIKQQIKQYGGQENYDQLMSMTGTTEQETRDNYIMTNLISHSVMEHYPASNKELHQLYDKMNKNTYTLSGVLVRTQKEASQVQDMLKNGKTYQDAKKDVNKNDFAYYHNTTPTDSARTLVYISGLSKDLANGVSKMKVGETKVIKSDSTGGYFVITLKNKGNLTFKQAKSQLLDQYRKDLMLDQGPTPIVNSLEKDYKRAGVHVTDKQFSYLNDIAQNYGQTLQGNQGQQ